MKGRLLAASGQALPSVPGGTEALKAEASSPKNAKVSIVDLLLAPGNKRQLHGGPADAVMLAPTGPQGAASESSVDLL